MPVILVAIYLRTQFMVVTTSLYFLLLLLLNELACEQMDIKLSFSGSTTQHNKHGRISTHAEGVPEHQLSGLASISRRARANSSDFGFLEKEGSPK